ncbi:replication initiator [Candidatus Solirubrobacter pratensis]|uniref:replication initiator n=1 Tax=Candidatus Solirubrobacter pratensis TaxID=1298857 RepID=UPI0003F99340|nr:replication initiator [Candidatus Solirubrobacter pratensis]
MTAAAITPELLDAFVERAGEANIAKLEKQLRSANYCARPIRLRGRIETCDAHGKKRVWSTAGEPDGVLRKACGNRREAVCPSCAERYRYDALHLIGAGLRGGKGVPETVAGHPLVFLTLTAPTFGFVHTCPGEGRRCRPRRDAETCPHGVRLSCGKVHAEDDPCLGEPICLECFDHDGALLWNNLLGELWRRTTIYLPRTMAHLTRRTQKRLKRLVRFSYVKVAEYQRRGLIHLHVVIRLDRAMPKYRAHELHPPAREFDLELLEQTIRGTVETVSAPMSDELGGGRVTWGPELDIQRVGESFDAQRCARYLAKYATKATEQAGGVLHRVTEREVDALPVRPHVREYLRRAFVLDGHASDRRLGKTAHAFGYRGHCLTKSRRYSTTFKALREAREAFVHEELLARTKDATQLAIAAGGDRFVFMDFVGQGHITALDDWLAEKGREKRREDRLAAVEALADHHSLRREQACTTPQ